MTVENENELTNGLGDDEFISRFEDCSLSTDQFHHRDHIRLTWLYLHRYGAHETLSKIATGLKRFAGSIGRANRYHETITWGYTLLIHERIATGGYDQPWEEFALANPDLMDWKESVLKNYYREETLASEIARRVFVLPDKSITAMRTDTQRISN